MFSIFLYSIFLLIFIFVIAVIFILADDCEANRPNYQPYDKNKKILAPDYYNIIKINEYRKRYTEKNSNIAADYHKYLKDHQIPDTLTSYKLFLKK